MATKQINFRIDADLEAQIRETATAQGMKVGEWLQKVAKQALGHEEEITTSDSNSKPDSNNNSSSEGKAQTTALEERVAKLEATLNTIDEEQTEQNHKIRENEASLSDLYQKQVSLNATVSGVRDELYLLQANTITDSSNSKTDSSDSNSASTNSKTDSSNSKPTSSDSRTLSATKLGERLGVSRTSVRKAKDKGADYFARWSQNKDPDNISWEYNLNLNQYQVAEGDQNDYKANHKPSDDEHQISNGDKYPNGHQDNAPSVEQLEKYPAQTP